MKEYGDEGFIALLREGRAEAKKDIRKGKVLADGQVLEFREREIIKKMLWMWLPDGFGPLSGGRKNAPGPEHADIQRTDKAICQCPGQHIKLLQDRHDIHKLPLTHGRR